MSLDFDSVKKKASRRTDTVRLCLAGELVEEYERLERELANLKPATSLGDAPDKQGLIGQLEAIRVDMADATVEFKLRALPPRPWALFYAAAPTRKEGESDEAWEPRNFAWQADMVSRTCYDPVMTVEQVEELVELLPNARSWLQLTNAAFLLNVGGIDLPNFVAASDLIPPSDQT